jgi:hypothetical protein
MHTKAAPESVAAFFKEGIYLACLFFRRGSAVHAFVMFIIVSLLVFLNATCGLFPTSSLIYDFIKGGRHFTGEDFEANDDEISIRYPWKIVGDVKVVRDASCDGAWSLRFGNERYYNNSNNSISLECVFDHDTNLFFSVDSDIGFYIDSSYAYAVVVGKSICGWWQFKATIPSGKHTIEWNHDPYSEAVRIDTITVN